MDFTTSLQADERLQKQCGRVFLTLLIHFVPSMVAMVGILEGMAPSIFSLNFLEMLLWQRAGTPS